MKIRKQAQNMLVAAIRRMSKNRKVCVGIHAGTGHAFEIDGVTYALKDKEISIVGYGRDQLGGLEIMNVAGYAVWAEKNTIAELKDADIVVKTKEFPEIGFVHEYLSYDNG
jgi:hypothetical protein